MSGKKIGYIRVSTVEQNSSRQLEGIELDRMFTDQASGKDSYRPQLQEMLLYARDGDTIIVHSMDRLARNLDDLRRIVFDLNKRQVNIQFIKEGLTFTGEDSPMSKLLLSVMGSVAEFERSLIKERQREGIELAKKKGIYKGRKNALDNEQVIAIHARIKQGESKTAIAKDLQISRETLYKYLQT
ncbi:MAG: recombinase family protein [Rickettsiaceae bacterium]|nr:MAG: recombinase family protein [Rickettsiaceae bacterium]